MDRYIVKIAIEKAAMKDMQYGVDDCCCWVGDIILEHGGPDIIEPFGGYMDETGAAIAMRRYAGGSLLEACQKRSKELNFERVKITDIQDGDIGLVTSGNGHLMALFLNSKWIARSKVGISYTMAKSTILAWRVPCLH